MKKTKVSSTNSVYNFFSKNVGFLGLITVITFLLVLFLVDRITSLESRLRDAEVKSNSAMQEINKMNSVESTDTEVVNE